jgi:uncharacterized protein YpmB
MFIPVKLSINTEEPDKEETSILVPVKLETSILLKNAEEPVYNGALMEVAVKLLPVIESKTVRLSRYAEEPVKEP